MFEAQNHVFYLLQLWLQKSWTWWYMVNITAILVFMVDIKCVLVLEHLVIMLVCVFLTSLQLSYRKSKFSFQTLKGQTKISFPFQCSETFRVFWPSEQPVCLVDKCQNWRLAIDRLLPLTKQHSGWLDLIRMQSFVLGGRCVCHHGNQPYQQTPLGSFVICQLTPILLKGSTRVVSAQRRRMHQEKTRGGWQQRLIYWSSLLMEITCISSWQVKLPL